jgi:uncharacterized membrane protein
MSISCPECAASMPDTAAFCPACGRAMREKPVRGTVGALPETIAGALAYCLVPAIVFLLVDPYKKNGFVRFHAFQCLGLCLSAVVIGVGLRVASLVLFFIPLVGPLFILLASTLVGLAFFVIWAVLIVKALQGEMFKLPLLGDFAERQAVSG